MWLVTSQVTCSTDPPVVLRVIPSLMSAWVSAWWCTDVTQTRALTWVCCSLLPWRISSGILPVSKMSVSCSNSSLYKYCCCVKQKKTSRESRYFVNIHFQKIFFKYHLVLNCYLFVCYLKILMYSQNVKLLYCDLFIHWGKLFCVQFLLTILLRKSACDPILVKTVPWLKWGPLIMSMKWHMYPKA